MNNDTYDDRPYWANIKVLEQQEFNEKIVKSIAELRDTVVHLDIAGRLHKIRADELEHKVAQLIKTKEKHETQG